MTVLHISGGTNQSTSGGEKHRLSSTEVLKIRTLKAAQTREKDVIKFLLTFRGTEESIMVGILLLTHTHTHPVQLPNFKVCVCVNGGARMFIFVALM